MNTPEAPVSISAYTGAAVRTCEATQHAETVSGDAAGAALCTLPCVGNPSATAQ
jgi:hypothetical protein